METLIAIICFVVTVALYFVVKRLYKRFHVWWLSPLFAVPVVLVAGVLVTHVSYSTYFSETRWLSWLLGPATVAFAVPIYEQRALIRKHWFPLLAGVAVGMPVAMLSSVWLARLLGLSDMLQKSLAPRSISTPFAMAAAPSFGAEANLTAVFVVITGVCGMLIGELMISLLPLRSRLAKGALFGAAAHGAGTAKANEIGAEEGVVASLTMMFGGLATVLAAPMVGHLL